MIDAEHKLDDLTWLVSSDAHKWLNIARLSTQSKADLVRLTNTLRKDLSPERTHLVIELSLLRNRAREKFSQAAVMFFTEKSLVQSTDEQVARYKARKFPNGVLVHDLCCGIGGDLLGLASRGPCVGVEKDCQIALFAKANAAALGVGDLRIENRDVADVMKSDIRFFHIDPDRRPDGVRTSKAEFMAPGLAAIESSLESRGGCVKLAPGGNWPDDWPVCEREWISSRGECRQQVAWFGELAPNPNMRTATFVHDGAVHSFSGVPEAIKNESDQPRRFVYEPDPAVLAARLESSLANAFGLAALGDNVAYFTSDTESAHPLLDRFEMLETLPFDRKRLRAKLREDCIGTLEIKVRGVDVRPEDLRRDLKLAGPEQRTLFVYPSRRGAQAILSKRRS